MPKRTFVSKRGKHARTYNLPTVSQSTLATLALGAALSLGNSVQAEEVTAEVAPTNAVTSEVSQAVTETQVNQAHQEAKSVGTQAKNQESLVTQAQSNLTQVQENVTSLQGQILATQDITQESVNQAQSQLNQANQNLSQAGEALQSANNTLDIAKDSVEKHQDVLQKSQELNQQATAQFNAANEKVNALLKQADVDELQKNIENESNAVNTAKEVVQNTEIALEAAKYAKTNYNKALEEAKIAVENAQNNADSAFNNLEATKSELAVTAAKEENAQKDLEEAQKGKKETTTVQVGTETTVKNAEAKVKSGNVDLRFTRNGEAVYTNEEYLNAIKALADGSGTAESVREAAKKGYLGLALTEEGGSYPSPSSANYKLGRSNSRYEILKAHDGDKNIYDVFALPEEKIRDLALFYAALVNEMRSKVGNQNYLVVTDESMASIKKSLDSAFTKFTTRTLNGEFHTAGKDRNTPGLLTNQDEFKGTTNSFRYYSWDFNDLQAPNSDTISTTVSTYPTYGDFGSGLKLTMSQLKTHILHAVGRQLYHGLVGNQGNFNGKESENFEAALAILGLDGKDYNAVGFDIMPGNASGIGGAMDSFPSFFTRLMKSDGPGYENPYMEFTGGETTTTPIYETKETVIVDEEAVQKAIEALESAKAESQAAQVSYEKAKESYELAKSAVQTVKENLAAIKSNDVDIPSLEQALVDAQATLTEAEARLEANKTALALANAHQAEQIKALENAKFELAQAEEAKVKSDAQLVEDTDYLRLATAGLDMAQKAVALAEGNLKAAETNQSDAQKEYDDVAAKFANRDKVLAELYEQLKAAEVELAKAKENVTTESDKLVELQTKASDLWAKYLDLKARYDAQKGNANNQQVADKAKEIIESGNKVVPVVDGSGKVVDVVSDNSVQSTNKDNVVLVDGEEHQVLEDGSLKKVEKPQVDNGGKPSTDKGNNSTNSGNSSTNNDNSSKTPSTSGQKVPVGFTVGSSYVNLPSESKGADKAKPTAQSYEVRSLPNTGSVGSVALSAIGSVLGMFGFASVKRKKD